MRRRGVLALAALSLGATVVLAAPAFRSGPQPGEKPLPFTSNMVSGPNRGKQYCYICELKDEPAVLVFARRTDENTARLMRELRDAVRENRSRKLFSWFVFLGQAGTAAETSLEQRSYDFARANGAASMPVSALGDPEGPPGYLISPDADVTVIMFRSGKIVTNAAYRASEWNPRAVDAVLKDLPKLLGSI